jgi:hypothetical protein
MDEWIAGLLAAAILFFVGYQFWQYCHGENLNATGGIAKLYRKFVADFMGIFPGPRA